MKNTDKRSRDHFRLRYWQDAELVGSHQLPRLSKQQYIPHDVISFNERNQVSDPENHWLDFFIDDSLFEPYWDAQEFGVTENSVVLEQYWRRMNQYMSRVKRFGGVIAPDYSMVPEMHPDQSNWNCARSQISAWRLEQEGVPCVPVAMWRDVADLDWCFDAFAPDSSIAISTNGCHTTGWGKGLFLEGTKELCIQKHPYALIVCGTPFDELYEIHPRIISYPSFSQRMHRRIRNGK